MSKSSRNWTQDLGWSRRCRLVVATSLIALSMVVLAAQPATSQTALVMMKPDKLRDPGEDLRMKITKPFTVVAVGDLIQMTPFSKIDDPDIQYLLDIMRKADLTLANNENNIVDHDTYRGPICHMEAPASVADDWANMGVDMVTKANNHTFDCGEQGLWADFHELDRVGIQHVGADYNQIEARMARFVVTPKGTAGLVGAFANSDKDDRQLFGLPGKDVVYVTPAQLTQLRAMRDSILARRKEVDYPITMPAKDPDGEVLVFGVQFKVGKPGDTVVGDAAANELKQKMVASAHTREKPISKGNDLHLSAYATVTAEQMAQLRAIAGDTGGGDTLAAFGVKFKIAARPGEYSYDMNPQDLRDILREVRTGKQFYDFQSVTIHWHQNRYAFQAYSFDHYPADFEIAFAHDAIDQGADLFFAHGVHTLKGVEIYKGKPIFYGLSNFVWQPQEVRSWRDFGDKPPTPLTGPIVGEGEENEESWAWLEQPANKETLVTSSHYENGKLVEVRLYPADMGLANRPWSQSGIPKRPSPELAQKILERVAEYSKPFGTKISIENGVGIIRIPQPNP